MAAPSDRSDAMKPASLLSRFKGALVGAVVGDCLGAHFEGVWIVGPAAVDDWFKCFKTGKKTALQEFTDDTAMARSVASSLIQNKKLDAKDMAKRFAEEFMREPGRGYGANVGAVFKSLTETEYSDPFGPASLQFDGQGSYGNGGAMRIAPAALYGLKLPDPEFKKLVTDITRITHSHPDAINGALLQCLSVRQALQESPDSLDNDSFLQHLFSHMLNLETVGGGSPSKSPEVKRRAKRKSEEEEKPFCYKLSKIKDFLKEEDVSRQTIEEVLGNDISALGSVPAAVYSFLRSRKPVPDLEWENPMERTLVYAVSLGGDTDTIATMAGAIAGAYYGIESIPLYLQKVCEGVNDAIKMADKLYAIHSEHETKKATNT